MTPFRVSALCLASFLGGLASFALASYLWLDRALSRAKW